MDDVVGATSMSRDASRCRSRRFKPNCWNFFDCPSNPEFVVGYHRRTHTPVYIWKEQNSRFIAIAASVNLQ